jgi:hypothetical protein
MFPWKNMLLSAVVLLLVTLLFLGLYAVLTAVVLMY